MANIIAERLLSFMRGRTRDVVSDQPESQGKGVMYDFNFMGREYYGHINAQYSLTQKRERLMNYREMEFYPEIAYAIDLIIDSCISQDIEDNIATMHIRNEEITCAKNGKLAELLQDEWNFFLEDVYGGQQALETNFRRWFVDGQLYLENVRHYGKGGFVTIKKLPAETMLMQLDEVGAIEKYFQVAGDWSNSVHYGLTQTNVFNPSISSKDAVEFKPHEITYIDSSIYGAGGFHDPRSRLEAALRTYRQLKLIEDALVIYRLVRAPEKRIFNVEVGTMPKGQAEEYIANLIKLHRSKQFYDPTRGDVMRKFNPMSLNEDYWIPSRGGTATTKIDTLQGASNLGNITDVEYFLKKIYKALNVPTYLVQEEGQIGDKSEDVRTQDIQFAKFCERLQLQWSQHLLYLFVHHIRDKQLDSMLTDMKYSDIRIKMTAPSHYKEYRDLDLETARVNLYNMMAQSGTFPKTWMLKHVMKFTDEQIADMLAEMEHEEAFAPLVASQQQASPIDAEGNPIIQPPMSDVMDDGSGDPAPKPAAKPAAKSKKAKK